MGQMELVDRWGKWFWDGWGGGDEVGRYFGVDAGRDDGDGVGMQTRPRVYACPGFLTVSKRSDENKTGCAPDTV